MRIVALDAGRGHGAVSRTLAAAAEAAENAGAEVRRLRLADFRIRDCVGCGLCALGDGCKIPDDLPELSAAIAAADAVILGAPTAGRANLRAFAALTRRLRTWFQGDGQAQLPGLDAEALRLTPLARRVKRALIITGAGGGGNVGAFFAGLGRAAAGVRGGAGGTAGGGAQVRELRRMLASCHIDAVGSLSVRHERADGELSWDEWDRAASMGRLLAGRV
ncbi:MAG: NAD(P)H-dependent oxidoreductase [Actinomycetes bacterium]|jgi:NAD(P)H-dependent FMN reductase|nr:NAD(P)H-dependent oxidoreductase [Actinomycetes bacterium]